jgi:SAM-dependent methyltransferase
VSAFDPVADAYDAARPDYPDGVFDALGPLDGACVLDIGAGTGIASRELLRRGAMVFGVDLSRNMLVRARAASPDLPIMRADGARLPVPDGRLDLVCFAQSWHWIDEGRRCDEAARVLRAGGHWAAWWSHARADGAPWFERKWDLVEHECPGVNRAQRNTDWGTTVAATAFAAPRLVKVPWIRSVSTTRFVKDQSSQTYLRTLGEARRGGLLSEICAIVDDAFPTGTMTIPYETWLWIAVKR